MEKELLDQFEGKMNVTKIIYDNGVVSYLTQSRSFDDEISAKGASRLNTIENEKKHVFFLFDNNDNEVGRYYLGKHLQGKSPSEIIELKDNLVFFESFNSETKQWVPCIGISANNPLKDIASKAIPINNSQNSKKESEKKNPNTVEGGIMPEYRKIGREFCKKIEATIPTQVYEHFGNTIKRDVRTTKHLLLLQQLLNNSIYVFKYPSDRSGQPSFMWNDEGLFMGDNVMLPYTIPFLWIRTIAKRDVGKFDEVIDLLIDEFGIDVSGSIDTANLIQGIRQYGLSEFQPNFNTNVNKTLLLTLYGDVIGLNNFILFFGSNIDMSALLPSQTGIVNIPSASFSLNNVINEMIDDFRKGNIESK